MNSRTEALMKMNAGRKTPGQPKTHEQIVEEMEKEQREKAELRERMANHFPVKETVKKK